MADPVAGAATTSGWLLRNQKVKAAVDPFTVVALHADTKSTGRSIQVMPQSAIDRIPSGPKLDALTAEKVFGWTNEGALVGKKQDKAGR